MFLCVFVSFVVGSCADSNNTINASVSRSAGGPIHLTVCNLDPRQEMPLTIDLHGMTPRQASGRTLTAPAMDAHNTFDQPDAVMPVDLGDATIHRAAVTVTLPARSVTLLTIE